MCTRFPTCCALLVATTFLSLRAQQIETSPAPTRSDASFKPFTGKVIGNSVRVRVAPELDSHIVMELPKGDYVVVTADKGDFYAVQPPIDTKAFIFRGFVIDDIVEGERVNVRLAPDREAPIVGHYSTGTKVHGKICAQNNRWLEIEMPIQTVFFIAKEYIEYAGNPEVKSIHDKRRDSVKQLFEATQILTQTEMLKPFYEIDEQRIVHNYNTIIADYSDFDTYVEKSTRALSKFREDYLRRKVAHLELKSSKADQKVPQAQGFVVSDRLPEAEKNVVSPTDRMKIWEPVEEALYLSWSAMHHAKTMRDFYRDQKLKGQIISGLLESYREPIKSKPGDYILKEKDVPFAYVYSTHVDLEELVGKRVTLTVSPRENNNFAFPAFYVLDVQ